MNKIIIIANEQAPKWVSVADWYFMNSYNEEWFAKMEEESLLIARYDETWEDINLDAKQAQEVFHIILGTEEATESFLENPINQWVLNLDEKLWIASVIAASKNKRKSVTNA